MDASFEKAAIEPATREITSSAPSRPSTSSTTRNAEDLREEALRNNPNGSTRAAGISVSQAEADFWDPSTQLRVIKKKHKPPPYPEPAGWGD